MCCGQKRASLTPESVYQTTLRSNSIATSAPAAARPVKNPTQRASVAQPPPGWSSVGLRYLERSPIRVRGPATGRQYEFSAVNSVQSVDARDAESLLNTRFFAKTG
jgi:hypothetical protein